MSKKFKITESKYFIISGIERREPYFASIQFY